MSNTEEFHWECQPEAEKYLQSLLDTCIQKNSEIKKLSEDLLQLTSTRLFDWVDYYLIDESNHAIKKAKACGFTEDYKTSHYRVFNHHGAILPSLVIHDASEKDPSLGLAVNVDNIGEFLMAHQWTTEIQGSPKAPLRKSLAHIEGSCALWAVERRGTHKMEPVVMPKDYAQKYMEALELWQTRPRDLVTDDAGMDAMLERTKELVKRMGQEAATWIIFEVERMYWQCRNQAAQVQKNRQDKLGMGWANHDHHTYRSSRKQFPKLMTFFELLGFKRREKFYAGKEAGWGAQVMEHQSCRIILFLDLDLTPEEVEVDFTRIALDELESPGTVGLWCALHGESALQAGMHHLECQFDFESLRKDLKEEFSLGMMEPFSSFTYLKQAFTEGEIWQVNPKRLQNLLEAGQIKNAEAERFLLKGAIGSHLENLERNEGYKGFNQKNVSLIIKKTDPRAQMP